MSPLQLSRHGVLLILLGASAPLPAQLAARPEAETSAPPVRIQRYALVVGIEDYVHLDDVANARNDALAIAESLSRIGFDHVRVLQDPDPALDAPLRFMEVVNALASQAEIPERAATIVLYFAGHGFQHEGVNYLALRGAPRPGRNRATGSTDKTGLLDYSVRIPNIVAGLRSRRQPGVTILFVDACRTNILGSEAQPAFGAEPAGFSMLTDAQGAVVSFAATWGTTAKSRTHAFEANSPYAGVLKDLVAAESIPLNPRLLLALRSQVAQLTNHRQVPESINPEAAGYFYFLPGGAALAAEDTFWSKVWARKSKKCFQNFLTHYPDGRYAQHAVNYMKNETLQESEDLCDIY